MQKLKVEIERRRKITDVKVAPKDFHFFHLKKHLAG